MLDNYKNKYTNKTLRLQNWDYGWDGIYFITICTKDRENYFGNIENNKMNLSNIGVIADILWHEIKNHAKNIELDQFVVMPNHIHGILIIDKNNIDNTNHVGQGQNHVGQGHTLDLRDSNQTHPNKPEKTIGQKRFQNIGKNTVSSIIGSYKSAVTKHARRLGYNFYWQPRFYDHIIRNDKEYHKIKNYIINNPNNWNNDKFYD